MACRLVLFDVDGVLLDSLGPHLQICRELGAAWGLPVRVPDAATFKTWVRQGLRVSPMSAFFAAVGFPAEVLGKANQHYEREFLARHAPMLFADVPAVLGRLHARGLWLGLVTANVKANVWPALGESATFLRSDCVFTGELDGEEGRGALGKAEAIAEALRRTGARPDETLFVGDQPSDEAAARAAGVPFLGAAYGWGFDEGPERLGSLRELCDRWLPEAT